MTEPFLILLEVETTLFLGLYYLSQLPGSNDVFSWLSVAEARFGLGKILEAVFTNVVLELPSVDQLLVKSRKVLHLKIILFVDKVKKTIGNPKIKEMTEIHCC